MLNKIFAYLATSIVVFQLLFSIYYSSEIDTQNNLLHSLEKEYQDLKSQNQNLEINYTQLSSLTQLKSQIASKNLVPILEEINLNKN